MIPVIQYTVVFSNLLGLEDKFVRRGIEDKLGDFNFSYIAMPPGIDTNVPQMLGQTHNGHTKLQISNQYLQMKIDFDENYRDSRENCFEYAFEKIEKIEKLMRGVTAVKFSGVLVSYILQSVETPIESVNRNSVKIPSECNIFGFSKRFSYIYNDKYFVNFDISASAYPKENQQINITVDINNRYGSDVKNQPSETTDIQTIKSLHDSITQEALDNLIREGELKVL